MIYKLSQNRTFLHFLHFQNENALFIVSNRIKVVVESLWQEGKLFLF